MPVTMGHTMKGNISVISSVICIIYSGHNYHFFESTDGFSNNVNKMLMSVAKVKNV